MHERDENLDKLAHRLSRFVDGENMLDIATVCARLIAFAVNESYEHAEDKIESLDTLIEFMRRDLEKMMERSLQ
jgi:hypothetical protein